MTTTTKSEAVEMLKAMSAKLDMLTAEVAKVVVEVAQLKTQVAPYARPAARSAAGGEPVLPNYGRAKGQPVRGADRETLEYYADGARRSLADPAKERWHEKERTLLAAIEAELARQSGGDGPPPHTDSDAPSEETPF